MKKPRAPRLVTVAVFTTITIVFWVFFTLYNILTSKPDLKIDEKILEPLNPSLDTETLDKIEDKIYYDENAPITPLVLISPGQSVPTIIKSEITPSETQEIPISTEEATLEEIQ